jgi:hypothetical protein
VASLLKISGHFLNTRIDFLDTLREALWETYGEQITHMHREGDDDRIQNINQCEFEFDDDISF